MRTRIVCVAGIVLIWVVAFCWPAPADDSIHLPMVPVLIEPDAQPRPVPIDPSEPVAVSTLTADSWYVIESDAPLIVLSSPTGLVQVQADEGPLRVRGIFADGTGETETRTYQSKNLYFVNAIKAGSTELLVVPVGVSDESQIVRQVLTVTVGPRPPPGPGPEPQPNPQPKPEPTPQAENVSLAIVEDTMNRSPEMAITMNGLVGWTAFVDSGNDWRAYDLTTGEARGQKAITDLNGPSPGIVVYNKATGTMIHRGDMPATIDELKTLIGGLTGG